MSTEHKPHGSSLPSFDEEHDARDLFCRHCGAQFKRDGKWLSDVLVAGCAQPEVSGSAAAKRTGGP
jgi:hypothetical protein